MVALAPAACVQFNMGCDRASLFVNFDKPYP